MDNEVDQKGNEFHIRILTEAWQSFGFGLNLAALKIVTNDCPRPAPPHP